ncbi:MAG: hypothetical protein AAFU60_14840, partial [Bacteroidota bacterium]
MYWNRKIEIAGQVLIWLLLFGLSVSFLREITSFSNSLSLSVKGVVLLMVVAYLNSLYLIPRFFLQNQFSRYFFSIGLLVFGLLSLNYWLAEWPMFQMPPRDSMPFLRDLPMEQVYTVLKNKAPNMEKKKGGKKKGLRRLTTCSIGRSRKKGIES